MHVGTDGKSHTNRGKEESEVQAVGRGCRFRWGSGGKVASSRQLNREEKQVCGYPGHRHSTQRC